MKKVFRPNAAAVVFRQDKKVLMCRRIFPKTDGWQFPQGGIEAGETAQEAALRELKEETSVHSVTAVKTLDYPLRYEFPEEVKAKFRTRGIFNDGQEQYWSLFYFTGQEDEINLKTEEPEFDEFGWFDLEEEKFTGKWQPHLFRLSKTILPKSKTSLRTVFQYKKVPEEALSRAVFPRH